MSAGSLIHSVKLVIDGVEIELQAESQRAVNGMIRYKEPEPYASMPVATTPLMVTVRMKPGWSPTVPPEGKEVEG